jgi:hypothetical protein
VAALLVRLSPVSGSGSRHRGEIETVPGKRLRESIGKHIDPAGQALAWPSQVTVQAGPGARGDSGPVLVDRRP